MSVLIFVGVIVAIFGTILFCLLSADVEEGTNPLMPRCPECGSDWPIPIELGLMYTCSSCGHCYTPFDTKD